MSGGAYNYLHHADAADLLQKHRTDLADMVTALTDAGAADAAEETETILLILRHFEVRMQARIKRLAPVWKALDYLHSGDWSQTSFDNALAAYRDEGKSK